MREEEREGGREGVREGERREGGREEGREGGRGEGERLKEEIGEERGKGGRGGREKKFTNIHLCTKRSQTHWCVVKTEGQKKARNQSKENTQGSCKYSSP